jgi:hypothetical protein
LDNEREAIYLAAGNEEQRVKRALCHKLGTLMIAGCLITKKSMIIEAITPLTHRERMI